MHLLPALTKGGATEMAYRLLRQQSFPSWLYPVTQGATTMWERWDSWHHEFGLQTPTMNSFNHFAYGCVGDWMMRTMIGICDHPDAPGFRTALIAPQPGGGLSYAKGSYTSQFGTYKSSWKVKGNLLQLDVTIPAGCSAEVHIPCDDPKSIRIDGKKVTTNPANGAAVVTLGSGEYAITSHWSVPATTINILVFTIVPFLLAERARINKPEAHAVLILDCWWGWLSPIFIAYVRVNYPWIHLVFVPANCTPWAQPIDRGFVTWLKALLRWFSNELIMNMVLEQLNKEKRDPGSVNIDIYGAASCKKNLIIWVAAALAKMSEDTARVESYWTSVGKEPVFDEARAAGRFQTGILDAWRPNVQMEAVTRRNELFANLAMEQNGEKPSERSSAADFEELGWGDDAGLSAELQAAKLLLADPANPSRTTPLTELTVAQSDELHDLLLAAVEKHAKNVPPAADVAAVLQAAAAAADAGVLDFGEALADAPEQAELVEEEELPTPPSPPPASLTLDELHAVPRECFSRAMLDLLGDADECRVDAVVSQCAEYISAAGYAPLDTAVVVALLVGLMNTNRIMLNPELTMVYRLG
jgi:hypothetical protein